MNLLTTMRKYNYYLTITIATTQEVRKTSSAIIFLEDFAMADIVRQEQELKDKCATDLKSGKVTDPIEKLRLNCLSRGASGIKGLARYV